jgi:hypothetical protein
MLLRTRNRRPSADCGILWATRVRRADSITMDTSRHWRLPDLGHRIAAAFTKHPTLRVVVFAVGWRAFSSFLALLSAVLFPLAQKEQFTVLDRTHLLWDSFARFDSGWYFGIARYGYEFVEGGRSNLAFFPLYPMLMRYVAIALGGGRRNVYLAGILISWTCFVVASALLYRLARHFCSEDAAVRAVIYTSVFPFGFFFGVVYSESLYLMLIVGSFLAFTEKRWLLGGLAGAALSATRVNGILALPALAWVAWQAAGQDRIARRYALVGIALVPFGFEIYASFVYSLSGSFLEWMYSIQRWNYYPGGPPWTPLVNLLTPMLTQPYRFLTEVPGATYDLLNGLAVIFSLAMLPLVKVRLGWPYVLLMVMNLWLPLSSGVLEGTGRYCTVLFPMFIALGAVRSLMLRQWILVVFAALYMLCRALFTNLHLIF